MCAGVDGRDVGNEERGTSWMMGLGVQADDIFMDGRRYLGALTEMDEQARKGEVEGSNSWRASLL